MAVICIAGIKLGIGKTSVAEMLLRRLSGWHVARVRVGDDLGEGHAEILAEAGHVLLAAADLPDDPEVRRFLDAGAESVTVLLAEPRGLTAGVLTLRQSLPPRANLLAEGNGFLWDADADVAAMVIGPGPSGKGLAHVRPSVRDLFPKIGLWVWNTRTNATEEGFFEFPQAIARMGFHGAISNSADFHHVNPTSADDPGNPAFIAAMRGHLERAWVKRGSDEFLRRIGFDQTGRG